MKVKDQVEKIKSEGFGEEIEFQMEASAKAFHILMARLYTDPIKAIIRELSCNGYDAQVEAGNPEVPMWIHLPNHAEPFFAIRDYGIGLSEADVKKVYTVIFKSTKTESNEFTGCLGLGSKTPFSYTRNFVVESFFQGKHYIYNAFYNKAGKPCMAPLDGHGQPTTEPNGVKITVAVKNGDNENWRSKSEEVYEYFKTSPSVVGARIEIKKPSYAMEGKNWKLRKFQWGDTRGMKVVMGNVAYSIGDFRDDSFDATHRSLLNCNIDISVNIGDVEMEANREGLHFDKRTINVIRRQLDKITEESQEKVSECFYDCKTLWEARCKYNELYAIFPKEIIEAVGMNKVQWKGQQLFDSSYRRMVTLPDATHPLYQFTKIGWQNKGKRTKVRSITADDHLEFWINDLKTGGYSRSLEYVADKTETETILCKFENVAEKTAFMDKVGIVEADWKFTSDLPKPVRAARQARGKSAKICKFVGTRTSYSSRAWENAEVDLEDGGYYVELNRFKAVDRVMEKVQIQPAGTGASSPRKVRMLERQRSISIGEIKDIMDALKICGFDVPVYGIKTALIPKAKKNGKWINVFDLARKKLPEFLKTFNVGQYRYDMKMFGRFEYELSNQLKRMNEVKDLVDSDSEIHKVFAKRKSLKLAGIYEDKCDALTSAYVSVFGKEYKSDVIENGVLDYVNKIERRYPLLDAISSYDARKDEVKKHVALYIDSVDKQEN